MFTTAVLVFCMVAFLHLTPAAAYGAHADDSMALVGALLGSAWWRIAIVMAVMLSTLTTLWTTILYLSRSVFAMGRDRLLPSVLGDLDKRDEPLVSLASVGVICLLCEVIVGFSKTASDQLTLVVNASSVFLGLLFVFTGFAAVRRFAHERGGAVRGVWLPALGAVGLLGVLAATIITEDRVLQWYAWGGLALGIPFAVWRGRATTRPPEKTAPAPS